MERRTWSPKQHETTRERWFVVDAEGKTLGRLASVIATTLRGKNKPTYAPHMDMGDFVIVVNAEKVAGDRQEGDAEVYYRHSGYPGGFKAIRCATSAPSTGADPGVGRARHAAEATRSASSSSRS